MKINFISVLLIFFGFTVADANAKVKASAGDSLSAMYAQVMKFTMQDFYKASFVEPKLRVKIQKSLSDADYAKADEFLLARESAIYKECSRKKMDPKDCEIENMDPFSMIEDLKKARSIFEKNRENSLQSEPDKNFLWVSYAAATKAQIMAFEVWMTTWTKKCMGSKEQNSDKCRQEDREMHAFLTDAEFILAELTKKVLQPQTFKIDIKEQDKKYEKYSK